MTRPNKITVALLATTLAAPTALVAQEYIMRAPVDADLSQWQVMAPEYGNWEATSDQYDCSTWTPDSFEFMVGESFEQSQSCSQDMERSVTHKEYDNFSGEERVISESVESDTHNVTNERQATGTRSLLAPEVSEWEGVAEPYDCSEWTPEAETVPENEEFVQSRTCMQEQEQTTTIWAEDISTGEQEIHSEDVVSQVNEITEEQDAIGTMHIGRNMCVDILERGESTGNGVYRVSPEGGPYRDAYCDMNGGGWTLYDSFGSKLLLTDNSSTPAFNKMNINNLDQIYSAGYDTYLTHVNYGQYVVNEYYLQFYYSSSPQGWIRKTMPDWIEGLKVGVSNEWYRHTNWVSYGSDTRSIAPYQAHTVFEFHSGGSQMLEIKEGGIQWVESVWVK